ncbi:MAG TPA: BPSS1780 family membrane protein [Burkholderiales bacterium]|nr:BPSS1780 family membrane protein [Burkholderiales bacterium]
MSANPQAAGTGNEATVVLPGNFNPNARGVPMGNGWNWLADAWTIFRKAAGTWIAMVVVLVLIFIVAHLIPLVGAIAMQILWPVFVGGLMLACRSIDQGGEPQFSQLFAGFQHRTGTLVALGAIWLALSFLIVVIAAAITGVQIFALMNAGGSPEQMVGMALTALLALLLILALMLPLVMATWFAPALIVFDDMGVGAAMKASFAACVKNVLPFLLYGLLVLLAGVIASIPLGLGWLVLAPVLTASVYTSYRDIYFE